ncbi:MULTISPECIES: YwdI family protein [Pontibacillus]|uniref:YwdI family protein n=1 Tax=Pontibacillus chungwhensis TaxID=265426 RepID=A0ABY8V227_9BACI|nr:MULTISPECIES: YwdI family protein [Pontibacillus]MCD5324007.1 YwdI family protein [Pontibacillus sp. HN14]WIF97931.1 YwdI family protein [Pontibacillus chungwhensis]
MSVSYDQILQKMMKEVQEASLGQSNPEKVKEHVRAVKLLSDLILDEQGSASSYSQPTPQPYIQPQKTVESPKPAPKPQPEIDHEEANGNSLFDF